MFTFSPTSHSTPTPHKPKQNSVKGRAKPFKIHSFPRPTGDRKLFPLRALFPFPAGANLHQSAGRHPTSERRLHFSFRRPLLPACPRLFRREIYDRRALPSPRGFVYKHREAMFFFSPSPKWLSEDLLSLVKGGRVVVFIFILKGRERNIVDRRVYLFHNCPNVMLVFSVQCITSWLVTEWV